MEHTSLFSAKTCVAKWIVYLISVISWLLSLTFAAVFCKHLFKKGMWMIKNFRVIIINCVFHASFKFITWYIYPAKLQPLSMAAKTVNILALSYMYSWILQSSVSLQSVLDFCTRVWKLQWQDPHATFIQNKMTINTNLQHSLNEIMKHIYTH